jgi:hypothetical protein
MRAHGVTMVIHCIHYIVGHMTFMYKNLYVVIILLVHGQALNIFIGVCISYLGPIKKKLVYHPSHPKKVRRAGGFYFFNFFYFLCTRFCCTMWAFKLHYYADIVAVVFCDKTCDTGP